MLKGLKVIMGIFIVVCVVLSISMYIFPPIGNLFYWWYESWVPRSMMDQWKVTEDGQYRYRFEVRNSQRENAEFRVHIKDLKTGGRKRIPIDIRIEELSIYKAPEIFNQYDWAVMEPTEITGYYQVTTTKELRGWEELVFLLNPETEEVELIEEVFFSHIQPLTTTDDKYKYRLHLINLFKYESYHTKNGLFVEKLSLIDEPKAERVIQLYAKDLKTEEEWLIPILMNLKAEEVWEITDGTAGWVDMEPIDSGELYRLTLTSKLLKEERKFEVNVETEEVELIEQASYSPVRPEKTSDGRYEYQLRFVNLFNVSGNANEEGERFVSQFSLMEEWQEIRRVELHVKDRKTKEERLLPILPHLEVEEVWDRIDHDRDTGEWVVMEPLEREGRYVVTLTSKWLKEERKFEVNLETHEVKELE